MKKKETKKERLTTRGGTAVDGGARRGRRLRGIAGVAVDESSGSSALVTAGQGAEEVVTTREGSCVRGGGR